MQAKYNAFGLKSQCWTFLLPRSTLAHTSRHFILFTAMACLCVLLGGPSCAAGADSLFIAGSTYYEPGVSGPGWAWTDADHLELIGYADISMSGMEVWGNLTLCGSGSLTATGSQCGIHVSQALVVDGCTVKASADGAGVVSQTVAGIAAGGLTVRGGGRVLAAGTGSNAGLSFYGVRLLDEGFGADVASETLVVNASWLDATGVDAGVACLGGSLVTARFVTPAGGAFGADGVVDAGGATATHVVIEPEGATAPAGKTDTPDGKVPSGGVDPAPAPELGKGPAVKPAVVTTNTVVTKTAISKPSKPKASARGVSPTLPKTADSHWIAVSAVLFLLGTALIAVARRC